ncbi:MAG: TatD family hydrolase [Candidatus Bathyarchaeota archaeon]|nr:MAG: TatD family hydrolase [Candidatus Bathyarchaeota archaeon]
MSISLEKAMASVDRHDPQIIWGVGCHPRKIKAQEAFDAERFRDLSKRTALIGEIGLDTGLHYGHATLEKQLETFREALDTASELGRIVSIHSYRATGQVIRELRQRPVAAPILHWWTGNVEETREAVELGC